MTTEKQNAIVGLEVIDINNAQNKDLSPCVKDLDYYRHYRARWTIHETNQSSTTHRPVVTMNPPPPIHYRDQYFDDNFSNTS